MEEIEGDSNMQICERNTRYRKQSLDEPIASRLPKIYEETMLVFGGGLQ